MKCIRQQARIEYIRYKQIPQKIMVCFVEVAKFIIGRHYLYSLGFRLLTTVNQTILFTKLEEIKQFSKCQSTHSLSPFLPIIKCPGHFCIATITTILIIKQKWTWVFSSLSPSFV